MRFLGWFRRKPQPPPVPWEFPAWQEPPRPQAVPASQLPESERVKLMVKAYLRRTGAKPLSSKNFRSENHPFDKK